MCFPAGGTSRSAHGPTSSSRSTGCTRRLETGDNRRAVRVGLAETSRVINSAAVIMISVFPAFVFSGDRVIAMFGVAPASAVALDAFGLRTLLAPALMHLLGGAHWWLPRRLESRLPRIGIEPPE